jgi:hypothetical protein
VPLLRVSKLGHDTQGRFQLGLVNGRTHLGQLEPDVDGFGDGHQVLFMSAQLTQPGTFINLSLSHCHINNAQFSGAKFRNAWFVEAMFSGNASLTGTRFARGPRVTCRYIPQDDATGMADVDAEHHFRDPIV